MRATILYLLVILFHHLSQAQTSGTSHAVIISGGLDQANNFTRYYKNTQSMYSAFLKHGIPEKNIRALFGDGGFKGKDSYGINPKTMKYELFNPDFDLNGDGTRDIKYSASTDGIKNAFNNLKKQAKPGDNIILYITDHGDTDGNVVLWNNERWSVTDIKNLLIQFDPSINIQVVTNMCFGGKLMELTAGNICASSNVDQYHESTSESDFDQFTESFASQVSDSKTSLSKAFDFSKKHDHPNNKTHTTSLNYFLDQNSAVLMKKKTETICKEGSQSPIDSLSQLSNQILNESQKITSRSDNTERKIYIDQTKEKIAKINSELKKLKQSWTQNQWTKYNNDYQALLKKWNVASKKEKESLRGPMTLVFEKMDTESEKQQKMILSFEQDLKTLDKEILFLNTASDQQFDKYKKIKKCLDHVI